ncbi:MAG: hypothetical protein RIG77_17865 [Cyclobacteriaceae bacterium]
MEAYPEGHIAGLLGVHIKIIRRWFELFTFKPILGLPRLVGMSTIDNQVQETKRCFHKNEPYEIVFMLNGEYYKFSSLPDHFGDYGPTFKQLRLAQLYLNGADTDTLLVALKYERIDKLKRKLKVTPTSIRDRQNMGSHEIKGISTSYLDGDFMVETNNGKIIIRNDTKA